MAVADRMERQKSFHPDSKLQKEIERLDRNDDIGDSELAPEVHYLTVQKDKVPNGMIPLDGRAISRADNPKLFAAWGTQFGEGDGVTTFNIPDHRGKVPVGALDGETVGNDKTLGVAE